MLEITKSIRMKPTKLSSSSFKRSSSRLYINKGKCLILYALRLRHPGCNTSVVEYGGKNPKEYIQGVPT